MFCIQQIKLHEYIQKGTILFMTLALLVLAAPSVGAVFAETGEHIVHREESTFPISVDTEPRYEKWVVATAYSSDPWQTDNTPCLPAMQFDLCKYYEEYGIEDTIAANFLPLGTQVKFPDMYGDKIFTVRDRMNARYNGKSRIDFWVGSVTPTSKEIIAEAKNKARGFGVQRVRMEVYAK